MKLKIKEGTTSKLIKVFIQDSTDSSGAGLTGLTYNSSGLTSHYISEGDPSSTEITLTSATLGTYTSGGFVEVDSTNMPGVYEIGIPNAALDATSEGSVLVMLKGATNMIPLLLEIELDGFDYRLGFNSGDVDGFTVEESLKLCLAVLAGKVSGAGTSTITIRSADDSFDRIVASIDASGNRTSITLTETG
jgi:hypothetical protein